MGYDVNILSLSAIEFGHFDLMKILGLKEQHPAR